MRGGVNRPTLLTLAKIEAGRAGVVLEDLGDDVELRDGELVERVTLRDACAVLAIMRGTECGESVRRAGGLRVVSAARRADHVACSDASTDRPERPSGASPKTSPGY